jgi:hypothetical protein
MLLRLYRRAVTSALVLGSALVVTVHGNAQALPSVDRGAELSTFVLATSINPDYGQTRNLGYSVGFDYTRFLPGLVQPSLELRYTHANGRTVNEQAILGGLRLQSTIRNVHPYFLLMAGRGVIAFNFFNGSSSSNDAMVYAFGGGADLNVGRLWKVRADFSSQHWNLDPSTLTPSAISVGIAYRVPYGTRSPR